MFHQLVFPTSIIPKSIFFNSPIFSSQSVRNRPTIGQKFGKYSICWHKHLLNLHMLLYLTLHVMTWHDMSLASEHHPNERELFWFALHCLFRFLLHRIALLCSALPCITLVCIVVLCTDITLHYFALRHSSALLWFHLLCIVLFSFVLQCITLLLFALFCSEFICIALLHFALSWMAS